MMKDTEPFREKLFLEMKNRIKEKMNQSLYSEKVITTIPVQKQVSNILNTVGRKET